MIIHEPAKHSVRFEYRASWHADEERRRPVTIDLEVLDPADIIARDVAEAGAFYEIELLEHLGTRGPLGGVYVDVGANVGNHSVFFGKFLADHVVAVEPHPTLVPILTRNLQTNGVRQYSLLTCAVGDALGLGHLWHAERPAINHPRTQIHGLSGAGDGEALVPVVPLDDLIGRLAPRLGGRPVTCVKIDVEGMELAVLRGARQLLQTHRPHLVVELVGEDARHAVRTYLTELGYRDIGQRFCWAPTYHFIDPAVHRLRPTEYRPALDPAAERMRRMTEELCALMPGEETFILVDDEQTSAGLVVDGRRRLPFLENNGQYWGPPADSATAIRELERLRGAGARFIVFASNAFWWLDHYNEFADYLRAHYSCPLSNERQVVFDLEPSADRPVTCVSR